MYCPSALNQHIKIVSERSQDTRFTNDLRKRTRSARVTFISAAFSLGNSVPCEFHFTQRFCLYTMNRAYNVPKMQMHGKLSNRMHKQTKSHDVAQGIVLAPLKVTDTRVQNPHIYIWYFYFHACDWIWSPPPVAMTGGKAQPATLKDCSFRPAATPTMKPPSIDTLWAAHVSPTGSFNPFSLCSSQQYSHSDGLLLINM